MGVFSLKNDIFGSFLHRKSLETLYKNITCTARLKRVPASAANFFILNNPEFVSIMSSLIGVHLITSVSHGVNQYLQTNSNNSEILFGNK